MVTKEIRLVDQGILGSWLYSWISPPIGDAPAVTKGCYFIFIFFKSQKFIILTINTVRKHTFVTTLINDVLDIDTVKECPFDH